MKTEYFILTEQHDGLPAQTVLKKDNTPHTSEKRYFVLGTRFKRLKKMLQEELDEGKGFGLQGDDETFSIPKDKVEAIPYHDMIDKTVHYEGYRLLIYAYSGVADDDEPFFCVHVDEAVPDASPTSFDPFVGSTFFEGLWLHSKEFDKSEPINVKAKHAEVLVQSEDEDEEVLQITKKTIKIFA